MRQNAAGSTENRVSIDLTIFRIAGCPKQRRQWAIRGEEIVRQKA